MEVKYLFTPARSSTSHSSHVVYPCSGTSSSSTIPLPLSAEVLAVLPEASVGCLAATFRRHFLKPSPAQELGCFLAVDTPTSPAAGTLAVDDAADPLSAPLSDFILLRLNIFAQQNVTTSVRSYSLSERSTRNPLLFEACLDHRMQKKSQSHFKGVGRQTKATWKSIIRTFLRQGNMEFVLWRNEIVLPHID
ncbi:hypothetical protein B296_00003042 [Ensete ventricosum]|uniref:Uncharacterized protein n=1 Tax=Ensete ventricosum TaxID=4639 RepID=A0A427A7Y8_ENSVE|nr:hypothetical protein B296_00003042 [Ensete ventricosum]